MLMRTWLGCFALEKSSVTSEGLEGPGRGDSAGCGRAGRRFVIGGTVQSGPEGSYDTRT